jgi:nucleotide-binding universal stress UspA family protein
MLTRTVIPSSLPDHQAIILYKEGKKVNRKIIVPLDGSELAERALYYAKTAAARMEAGSLYCMCAGRTSATVRQRSAPYSLCIVSTLNILLRYSEMNLKWLQPRR